MENADATEHTKKRRDISLQYSTEAHLRLTARRREESTQKPPLYLPLHQAQSQTQHIP